MNFKLDPIRRFAFFLIVFAAVATAYQWSPTMLVHLGSTLGFGLVLYMLYSWVSSKHKNVWDTVITCLIIYLLLHPADTLAAQVYPLAAVFFAETIKFFIEWKGSPIVNPAATGLLLTAGAGAIFGVMPFVSWWGASFWSLPMGLAVSTMLLAVWIIGGFNVWRKWAVFFSFLVTFAVLGYAFYRDFTFLGFTYLNSTVYFIAAIMLPEPKTSPVMPWKQALYGAFAAALMLVLQNYGVSYAELFGIVGANLFNAALKWKPAARVIPVT